MRHEPVTIKDIAKQLGISPSTVSRALKNHPDISEKTRHTVQELAEKLHYKPNVTALNLRNNKSNTIAVIIPQLVHHFFSSVISGIEEIASNAGYKVMIYQSDESATREVMNVQSILSHRVDGVIISMTKETVNYEHFFALQESNIPMTFFDRICPAIDTDRVIIDDYQAAFTAVEHLISIGKRRIAHFAGPQNLEIGRLRMMGFKAALQKHKIPLDKDLVKLCDKHEQAKVFTAEMMNRKYPPDAIFAVNDLTAIGALITLKRYGMRIPKDVAVVGFTNGLISTVCDPSLTTIEQHGYKMGQKSANLLLDRIACKEDFMGRTEVISTELIIRQSTIEGRD